ncbi:mechanosensitive ion channel [Rhodocytophaga aerolata]|uniref:Mechanosensitive ion channel n=1 Tax=Rhodocytophaga aerolata TaxID=455078 RepID=A0ABT8R808_9BACT|nr:mechanosensitive ion channel domain-containing protein [Rhodocytophaga aerolata]MDO1447328.1 mechanosensitive ion channel [Rhodocytophaga aerolata]
MQRLQEYSERFMLMAMEYVPKVLLAIAVLLIGLWMVQKVVQLSMRLMERRDLDVSLRTFLNSLLSIGLKVLLFISVAGLLGIHTTSFVAILGAASLAVGLALQGSLSNFAGGVLILFFKPFRVGDMIEAQGQIGRVKEILIFNTLVTTLDNKTVIYPNGALSNGTIINYSKEGSLRVDITMDLPNTIDFVKFRTLALKIMADDSRILDEPAPIISLLKIAPAAFTVALRPYTTVGNYWPVFFTIQDKLKMAMDQQDISKTPPAS